MRICPLPGDAFASQERPSDWGQYPLMLHIIGGTIGRWCFAFKCMCGVYSKTKSSHIEDMELLTLPFVISELTTSDITCCLLKGSIWFMLVVHPLCLYFGYQAHLYQSLSSTLLIRTRYCNWKVTRRHTFNI